MLEVQTQPCSGCGQTAFFSMTQEQYNAWKQGEHVQSIFPDWSPDDREMLISGTCPPCWAEMWTEEEDWEDKESYYTAMSLLDPESSYPEYHSDYYVDRDCD